MGKEINLIKYYMYIMRAEELPHFPDDQNINLSDSTVKI